MTYIEQLLFTLEQLEISPSALSAMVGVTENSLKSDPPGPKAYSRIQRLNSVLKTAIAAGVPKNALYSMFQCPLDESTCGDPDGHSTLLYYVQYGDETSEKVMQLGIEIWLREIKIYELEEKLRKMK